MATVFLDLDGTLIDPYSGIKACIMYALEAMGQPVPAPASLRWAVGPPLLDSFARMGVSKPELALAHYRTRYGQVGLFEAEVYAGISEALAALKAAGHVLHLATAKPHVFARRITKHFGLAGFLDQQFGPELDGTGNDKGMLLAHALERLGTDPADCLMIGDRHLDYDAARVAGMKSAAVRWGFGDAAEWRQADFICDTPTDIPRIPWLVA